MNHCVPDFDIEEDDSILTSSALNRSKKSSVAEEEIMELLWQNGQVVAHSQSQRSLKKSHVGGASEQRQIRSEEETAQSHQLFMQEDEMVSWLHYPLEDSSFDRDFCGDLLYSAPVAEAFSAPPRQAVAMAPRPPVPLQRRLDSSIESQSSQQRYQNFSLFSRPKGRTESGPSSSNKTGKESTVVDSNDTPLTSTALESRVSCVADNAAQISGGNIGCSVTATATNTSPAACELTVSSSPGGSGDSVGAASAEPAYKLTTTVMGATAATTEDRKRKGSEADDSECQSEDVNFESAHAKKQVRGSTSTKRSRAAEVHNLSERRRRDRINEKMKVLQELIPRCNKSDKASMLDEAIEYLKSLQMRVQMMSMGCGMVPVLFPGVQQYMPPMGMGMGMGMSMDMGMNRPMLPFPSVLPGSALQNPAAAPHLAPSFPMPGFHMPPVSLLDPSRSQATCQSDLMLNSTASQNPNQERMSNFADPYQQYLGLHQAQVPLAQNQEPNPSKPNSSREGANPDNLQSG